MAFTSHHQTTCKGVSSKVNWYKVSLNKTRFSKDVFLRDFSPSPYVTTTPQYGTFVPGGESI